MNRLDELLNLIEDSSQLAIILRESNHSTTNCDENKSVMVHDKCFQVSPNDKRTLNQPQCAFNLVQLIIRTTSKKPFLIDDNVRLEISNYYKRHKLKAEGLISVQILHSLHSGSDSQTMVWIKYEAILSHLIKELVYEPRTMANEVLRTVKSELDPKVAAKFSSVLNGCVKICKEVNHKLCMDEEEQEKWCEIIDWMSWFLADDMDDM